MTLTLDPDVLTTRLGNEAVLLHLGTKQYHRLNETAAVVWDGIEQGLDKAALADSLSARFDADREGAEQAVAALMDDLVARRLVHAS